MTARKHHVRPKNLTDFEKNLRDDEKSAATIEKYLRDVQAFLVFCNGRGITKELALEYKRQLVDGGQYAVGSINSMLSSINSFLRFMGWDECRVKAIKVQRRLYCSKEKELTRAEYERLLAVAGEVLRLIIQTLCGTGIRVSELAYFTVEAVRENNVVVTCKKKTRPVYMPKNLRKLLLKYAAEHGITSGVVFRTRNGRPIDRSNIWAAMKRLCASAHVSPEKVFPHNLRKLFARTFYKLKKDIAKLADALGHSSINTTRIYIMTSGAEHRRCVEQLGLVT